MKRSLPAALLAVPLVGALAFAHHILGIPHYAYDESYPQAPVITYSVVAGAYDVRVTGYPGKPAPFERGEVRAYVHRSGDESDVFAGQILAKLERDGLFGAELVWGPKETRFEKNLHKASPEYGPEGNYRVRLEMQLDAQPYEIDFPLVVGDPADPVTRLVGFAGAALFALVVMRAVWIKVRRARSAA